MKTTIHQVPFRKFATSGSYLAMAIGLIFLMRFLLQLLEGGDLGTSRIADLITAALFILVGCYVINLYPDIEVCEDGLRVQVFGLHWMFVPWSDLIGITELKSPYSSGPSKGMMVQAHGLTFIHHLIVATKINETTRGFAISSSISEYDQLVETIRQKLEEGAT